MTQEPWEDTEGRPYFGPGAAATNPGARKVDIPDPDLIQSGKNRVELALEELRASVEYARACGVPFGEMNGLLGRGGVGIGMIAPTWS